jgi:hypothetical protein
MRRDSVVARAVALARANPRDPAALEALIWVIAGGIGWSRETDAAFDLLAQNHRDSDRLERVCALASLYRDSEAPERFLQSVLENGPHRALRGVACLALARRRKGEAEAAEYTKSLDAVRLGKEAEKYYERVLADYADVVSNKRPIGDRARHALFEMHNLIVGKPAPDIEGEDLDGKRFKLSDHRGKVVVLDFWGHW